MNYPLSPALKIGLIGGGQLAQMICLEAQRLGLQTLVLSENQKDPAAQACHQWIQGSLDDVQASDHFFEACDQVLFESEFLNFNQVDEFAKKWQKPCFPSPQIMQQLSDRWHQKSLLKQAKIPTSPFLKISKIEETPSFEKDFAQGIVIKKRTHGYDGKGTWIVRSEADKKKAPATFTQGDLHSIAEAFIPFQRELAFIIARSKDDSIFSYPLVETFQEDSRCLWIKGPIEHPEFSNLKKQFAQFLKEINYVGVMGVELFETSEGQLTVNEIAPRVHNSGHYTQNSHSYSQFALHLASTTGVTLEKISCPLESAFAMYNLIGSANSQPISAWTPNSKTFFHWYNKHENRPGRKMGHINALGKTPDEALNNAQQSAQRFQL